MMRSVTFIWILLAVAVSGALFRVSYRVQHLEKHLAAVNKQIGQEEETIRVLNAEWSYLNDPSRLEALARKHLAMAPATPAQIVEMDAVPAKLPPSAAAALVSKKVNSKSTVVPSSRAILASLKKKAIDD